MTKGDDDDALIGLVEICLEKPTGLLTPPLRPVDFFGLLAANKAKQGSGFQPYLCNLCIAEAGRRRGLGKLLCSICEEVLSTYKHNYGFKYRTTFELLLIYALILLYLSL